MRFLLLNKNMLWNSLEVPLGSAFNEYPQHIFHGEIRKILGGYPILSGAMKST